MDFSLFFLVLVLVPVGQSLVPDFCHDRPCPEYEVVSQNQGFEERQYPSSSWISTDAKDQSAPELMKANKRLHDFTRSYNSATTGVQVDDKTWPGLLTLTGCDLSNAEQVVVSWFLPTQTQAPPPQAPPPQCSLDPAEVKKASSAVREERRPATTVYVRTFDGIPTLERGLAEFRRLRNTLTSAGKTFDPCSGSAAGYDPVLSLTRHNEVWVYKNQSRTKPEEC